MGLNIQIHKEMHLDILQYFKAKQSSLIASCIQKMSTPPFSSVTSCYI